MPADVLAELADPADPGDPGARYLHVAPADAAFERGLLANSDGLVHLWPGDRFDLADEWRDEMESAQDKPFVIVRVVPPGPVEPDPYMAAAFAYRGDIPPECVTDA